MDSAALHQARLQHLLPDGVAHHEDWEDRRLDLLDRSARLVVLCAIYVSKFFISLMA